MSDYIKYCAGFLVIVLLFFGVYAVDKSINAPPRPNHTMVDNKNKVIIEWYTEGGSPKVKIFQLKSERGEYVGEVRTVNFLPR